MITPEKIETFLKDNQLNNVFTSPNTVRAYRSKLMAWFAFSVGTGNADDLCLAEKYLEHLTKSHGSKTVKSTLYVLKSFYDWVKSEQNPFEYLSEHYRINKRETALKYWIGIKRFIPSPMWPGCLRTPGGKFRSWGTKIQSIIT